MDKAVVPRTDHLKEDSRFVLAVHEVMCQERDRPREEVQEKAPVSTVVMQVVTTEPILARWMGACMTSTVARFPAPDLAARAEVVTEARTLPRAVC